MIQSQAREDFAKHWLEVEPAVSTYVFAAIADLHDAEDVVQRIDRNSLGGSTSGSV